MHLFQSCRESSAFVSELQPAFLVTSQTGNRKQTKGFLTSCVWPLMTQRVLNVYKRRVPGRYAYDLLFTQNPPPSTALLIWLTFDTTTPQNRIEFFILFIILLYLFYFIYLFYLSLCVVWCSVLCVVFCTGCHRMSLHCKTNLPTGINKVNKQTNKQINEIRLQLCRFLDTDSFP